MIVSEDDQTNDVERPGPAGETADDDLVARRRDVRGARRRDQILALLRTVESGSLSVEEIADRFGVSFATVRRDLSRLHQDRRITRTYGGVALTGPAELSIHQRHLEFTAEKDAIGRQAAELVADGAVVILDAGTTTEFVARHLDAADVTVFTNGIGAVNVLLGNADVSVVVLGGRLRAVNQTISGPEAEHMLRFRSSGLRVHRRRRGAPAVRRRVANARTKSAQDPDDAARAPDRGGRRSPQGQHRPVQLLVADTRTVAVDHRRRAPTRLRWTNCATPARRSISHNPCEPSPSPPT